LNLSKIARFCAEPVSTRFARSKNRRGKFNS
jgi:hypothetical protein